MNPLLPSKRSNTNPSSNTVLNLKNREATEVFACFAEKESGEVIKAFLAREAGVDGSFVRGGGVEERFSSLTRFGVIAFWRFLLAGSVGLLSAIRVGPIYVALETGGTTARGLVAFITGAAC